MKIRSKHSNYEQNETELIKAWENELLEDIEEGETLVQRKQQVPFSKWVQDLLDTHDFEIVPE